MHKESNADAKEETANDIIDITFLYDISWLSHVSGSLVIRCKIKSANAI